MTHVYEMLVELHEEKIRELCGNCALKVMAILKWILKELVVKLITLFF